MFCVVFFCSQLLVAAPWTGREDPGHALSLVTAPGDARKEPVEREHCADFPARGRGGREETPIFSSPVNPRGFFPLEE